MPLTTVCVTCRYYARRLSDAARRSARDQQTDRMNRDVYATTPCVVKDAAAGGGAILPPYELHFQTSSPSAAGWPARHGHLAQRRRAPDAEHDYESMDDDSAAATDPRYPGGALVDAVSYGYQAVCVDTALRPGGNGYSATVVSTPTPIHVSRHCGYPPTTFN